MANCSDIAVKNMEKIYYGEFSNLGNDNLYFACSYTKTVAGKDSTTKDYFTIPIIEISNAKLTY